MADPFSILAGTAGLSDVCVRVFKFLRKASERFQEVDEDLESLCKEVDGIRAASEMVRHSHRAGLSMSINPSDQPIVSNLWLATKTTLENCETILNELDSLLIGILSTGSGKHSKRDKMRKYLKQQSKEDEFSRLRQNLNAHQLALQVNLSAVGVFYTCKSQKSSAESFSKLCDQGAELKGKIVSLQQISQNLAEITLDNAVRSAKKIVPLASRNQHFYTPQAVSSIFTGRLEHLHDLQKYLKHSSSSETIQVQRRFVIYGPPGCGKTQFCCKLASDMKQRFWGVFWIDASSKENAAQSFSMIAQVGKVTPNQRAAKNWLSTFAPDKPWLLIIDNADEEELPVEDYFPDGAGGTIIITTRNPILRLHGTVGPGFFHFSELEVTESIRLLLKAASESEPWSESLLASAGEICKTLGYLPLALVHAGKTILGRLCTFDNYISTFEKNWSRIRSMKHLSNGSSISDANAAIYSSYELIYEGLSSRKTQACDDALVLLKVFSFLHPQNIRTDTFKLAAINPQKEMQHQRQTAETEGNPSRYSWRTMTWGMTFRNVSVDVISFFLQLGIRPVIPSLLRTDSETGCFDEVRLRQALKELFQKSLIFESQDDSFSMHPAVHLWVRERPEMALGEQAVWCHMAANVLSRAILLPPLGDKVEDETFRRNILPHVNHVRQREQVIHMLFSKNQERRRHIWPILQPRLDRQRALEFVKFSLVLAQGDQLKDAEQMQRRVADFAIQNLGLEHTRTIDILLLLSSTYWRRTKGDEAADLQKQALEAAIKARGRKDLKTLRVMDAYGSSRWLQGRIPEAREIHTTAVEGLAEILGENHIDTLRAMGNLGRDVGKDFEFTKAIGIHSRVHEGLCAQLGANHLDSIIAMDNLAMAFYDRAAWGHGHPGDLEKAVEMEWEVFAIRKQKLGREHLYTLWAGLNLARIKAARGEVEEALSIFLEGHTIALRSLGETHFGVLLGKTHWARILMCAERYAEAESLLVEVLDTYEGRRQRHPDRLLAMFSLIKCRNLLGRPTGETRSLLDELIECTKVLFGPDHPSVRYLLDPQNLSEDEPSDIGIEPVRPMSSSDGRRTYSMERPLDTVMISKYGHI